MPIAHGDIKLNKSAVMLDVPEGGGGPVAATVPDGVSNAIFQDISELDRVNGRVNLRQLHVTVQSDNTDIYLGANVIVAEPPDDPNVSITLFSTGDAFDTRVEAVARMEAYLNVGGGYAGILFGNHIAGQATLLILQRTDATPAVGETLVLIKREGFPDEYRQYVRVTEASLTRRIFTDDKGDYERNVVTLTLSDVLRVDFLGFGASREDISEITFATKTRIYGSVVANAARYYGVVALAQDAALGDFVVKATSMFTQLVPSAQIETPIIDARTNQKSVVGVVDAGGTVTRSMLLPVSFSNSAGALGQIHIGGSIAPGSLSASQGGWPNFQDDGSGKLIVVPGGGSGAPVGSHVANIDYANGILTAVYADTIFVGSDYNPVVFQYRTTVQYEAPSQSQGFEITASNRALNYVRTIEPPPVPGSLTVSYRVLDRWYVLRDDGTGALRGSDTSVGAGSVNADTGTVAVTFGALPDVDTSVIYQWVEPGSEVSSAALTVQNDGKAYFAMNADGVPAAVKASTPLGRNTVTVTYMASGALQTATDDGQGRMTGAATGTVDYADGVVYLSPNVLPAPGAQVTLSRGKFETLTSFDLLASYVDDKLRILLPAGAAAPGTVMFSIVRPLRYRFYGEAPEDFGKPRMFGFRDDGVGGIVMSTSDATIVRKPMGTINYATGEILVSASVKLTPDEAMRTASFLQLYEREQRAAIGMRGV